MLGDRIPCDFDTSAPMPTVWSCKQAPVQINTARVLRLVFFDLFTYAFAAVDRVSGEHGIRLS